MQSFLVLRRIREYETVEEPSGRIDFELGSFLLVLKLEWANVKGRFIKAQRKWRWGQKNCFGSLSKFTK